MLNVVLIKSWVNTFWSDNKTEREVERKRAGLSFLIVNLGVPWALRPNSPVHSRSCPKRVLFFYFRKELPHAVQFYEQSSTTFSSGQTNTFVLLLYQIHFGCEMGELIVNCHIAWTHAKQTHVHTMSPTSSRGYFSSKETTFAWIKAWSSMDSI